VDAPGHRDASQPDRGRPARRRPLPLESGSATTTARRTRGRALPTRRSGLATAPARLGRGLTAGLPAGLVNRILICKIREYLTPIRRAGGAHSVVRARRVHADLDPLALLRVIANHSSRGGSAQPPPFTS